MELIKTYDEVGNVSEKTYYERSDGTLIETPLEIGEEILSEPALRRIYYKIKSE